MLADVDVCYACADVCLWAKADEACNQHEPVLGSLPAASSAKSASVNRCAVFRGGSTERPAARPVNIFPDALGVIGGEPEGRLYIVVEVALDAGDGPVEEKLEKEERRRASKPTCGVEEVRTREGREAPPSTPPASSERVLRSKQ